MHHPPDLTELKPGWARFCLGLERFVQDELGVPLAGTKLLAAFSGGVDSTALLLFLRAMRERWGAELTAVHLNHRLRPEADGEAEAAAGLCRRLGVPCYNASSRVAVYAARMGLGIEEAGRTLRYKLFTGLRRKTGADIVLLAHQLNDLAEDSLMRQLRGAGWPSLAGMRAFEPASGTLRPLLLTPKQQLASFVRELGYSWAEDASNRALDRLRNRVRHSLLPLLLEENPRFLDGVAQRWRQAEQDRAYWGEVLERLAHLERDEAGARLLPEASLAAEHRAARMRWYKDVLSRLGPGQPLAENLRKLDAAWLGSRRGKVFQFPGGKRARIEEAGIRFSRTEI